MKAPTTGPITSPTAAPNSSREPQPVNLLLGGALVTFVVLMALVSLAWTPHAYAEIDVPGRFQGPSWRHWLGTDQLGRDVVSQLMAGARNSVTIAFVAVLLGGAIGTLLGLVAAARGGLVEEVILRLADFGFAFPALLLAIMLATVFGPSLGNAVIAIAFINIPVFTRIVRASAHQVWTRGYVLAARASGRGTVAITIDHVILNVAAPIIVQMTIEFAVGILAEAALSFLGLGVQPPTPSWGRMLSEAQTLLFLSPQLAIYPGVCIMIAVLGCNLLGDGLRDVTDPRLRGTG